MIKIYSLQGCQQCNLLIKRMTERGETFEVVSDEAVVLEKAKVCGISRVPFVESQGEFYTHAGWNKIMNVGRER